MKTLKFKGQPVLWAIDESCKDTILDADGKMVAVVMTPDWDKIKPTASLITAAPELLAALGNFLTIIECNPELLESPCFKAAHDYANKVIKKALEE